MILKNLFKFILFSIAFLILYQDALRHMYNKWLTPEGSHGPLIILVSLYLIWLNRKKIKNLPASPGLLPGSILVGIGGFMLLSGKISSTMLIEQMSMIPMLLGTIWLFRGFELFKVFLLPVGYLIFLMGFIEVLLGRFSIHLQAVSAWIGYHMLDLIGYPVLLKFTIIELPHITLEVVRECNGISHIVSLMAFAVVLAYFSQKILVKKVIIILAAIVLGLLANGVRIALIGVYSNYFPGSNVHGPQGTLVVSSVFFIGLFMLVIFNYFLKKASFSKEPVVSSLRQTTWACSVNNFLSGEVGNKKKTAGKSFSPTILALSIFAVLVGLIYLYHPAPVHLKTSLKSFPAYIGGFTGKDLIHIDNRLRPFSAEEELLRAYEDAHGNRIELYIGYFPIQSRNKKIIDYRRAWMHEHAVDIPVINRKDTLRINKTRLRSRDNPADVYFWYFMNGKTVTDQFTGKFITLWDGLLKRKTNGAVIVIKTTSPDNEIMPLITDLVPMINKHLLNT